MALDREHFFRTLMDNMMVRASWAETVKGLSGVTGVSQVWGNQPEWYIWISGQPGPYGLVLEQTTEQIQGARPVHQGLFFGEVLSMPWNPRICKLFQPPSGKS